MNLALLRAPLPSLLGMACGLGLTIAALGAMPAGAATIVSYSFVVSIDSAGALQGQSFNGSLSYDQDLIPTPGFNGEDLFALNGFDFSFAGTDYGLSELSYGDAALAAGQWLGLDAGAPVFSFVPATGPFAASFAFDFGQGNAGFGSVSYRRVVNDMPEPASPWLLGIALLGAAGARRLMARR